MTWLLPGRCTVLIDAGTGLPDHLDALDEALAGRPLDLVVVTHFHGDHVSGCDALHARHPETRFAKTLHPERDSRYGVTWEPLADGQRVEAGDGMLEVVATPGHAPDHICFWDGEARDLYCGDLAIQGSTVVIPVSTGGDLTAYLASLRRVGGLEPRRMLPAHGPIIEDPTRLLRLYLAHRRERDAQVLGALDMGDRTADDVTRRLYGHLEGKLAKYARETVVAHLVKLAREGRIAQDGESWTRE